MFFGTSLECRAICSAGSALRHVADGVGGDRCTFYHHALQTCISSVVRRRCLPRLRCLNVCLVDPQRPQLRSNTLSSLREGPLASERMLRFPPANVFWLHQWQLTFPLPLQGGAEGEHLLWFSFPKKQRLVSKALSMPLRNVGGLGWPPRLPVLWKTA